MGIITQLLKTTSRVDCIQFSPHEEISPPTNKHESQKLRCNDVNCKFSEQTAELLLRGDNLVGGGAVIHCVLCCEPSKTQFADGISRKSQIKDFVKLVYFFARKSPDKHSLLSSVHSRVSPNCQEENYYTEFEF